MYGAVLSAVMPCTSADLGNWQTRAGPPTRPWASGDAEPARVSLAEAFAEVPVGIEGDEKLLAFPVHFEVVIFGHESLDGLHGPRVKLAVYRVTIDVAVFHDYLAAGRAYLMIRSLSCQQG